MTGKELCNHLKELDKLYCEWRVAAAWFSIYLCTLIVLLLVSICITLFTLTSDVRNTTYFIVALTIALTSLLPLKGMVNLHKLMTKITIAIDYYADDMIYKEDCDG